MPMRQIKLTDYIASLPASPLAPWASAAPWELTRDAEGIVHAMLAELPVADFILSDGIAIHRSAVVEAGAVLKGPLIVGPGSFIAAGAYLRGGSRFAA